MTNQSVPAAPVITSISGSTFFGQPAATIKGKQDLSGISSAKDVQITIFDQTTSMELPGTPVPVNSDGTWQAVVPSTSGDRACAYAKVITPLGGPIISIPSPTFVFP